MRASRIGSNLKYGMIKLDPAYAQFLLDTMERNRPVKAKVARKYASAIKEQTNGSMPTIYQPIIIDDAGCLIDGQHRCRAVVDSGMPVAVTCISGVPAGEWKHLDQGSRRGLGDVLGAQGEKNRSLLASLIMLVYKTETGDWSPTLSNEDGLKLFERHAVKYRRAAAEAMRRSQLRQHLTPTIAAYLMFHTEMYAEIMDPFYAKVESGVGITSTTDPANVLRNKMLQHIGRSSANLSQTSRLALCIKAANAALTGRSIKLLKFLPNEEFPVLVAKFGRMMED